MSARGRAFRSFVAFALALAALAASTDARAMSKKKKYNPRTPPKDYSSITREIDPLFEVSPRDLNTDFQNGFLVARGEAINRLFFSRFTPGTMTHLHNVVRHNLAYQFLYGDYGLKSLGLCTAGRMSCKIDELSLNLAGAPAFNVHKDKKTDRVDYASLRFPREGSYSISLKMKVKRVMGKRDKMQAIVGAWTKLKFHLEAKQYFVGKDGTLPAHWKRTAIDDKLPPSARQYLLRELRVVIDDSDFQLSGEGFFGINIVVFLRNLTSVTGLPPFVVNPFAKNIMLGFVEKVLRKSLVGSLDSFNAPGITGMHDSKVAGNAPASQRRTIPDGSESDRKNPDGSPLDRRLLPDRIAATLKADPALPADDAMRTMADKRRGPMVRVMMDAIDMVFRVVTFERTAPLSTRTPYVFLKPDGGYEGYVRPQDRGRHPAEMLDFVFIPDSGVNCPPDKELNPAGGAPCNHHLLLAQRMAIKTPRTQPFGEHGQRVRMAYANVMIPRTGDSKKDHLKPFQRMILSLQESAKQHLEKYKKTLPMPKIEAYVASYNTKTADTIAAVDELTTPDPALAPNAKIDFQTVKEMVGRVKALTDQVRKLGYGEEVLANIDTLSSTLEMLESYGPAVSGLLIPYRDPLVTRVGAPATEGRLIEELPWAFDAAYTALISAAMSKAGGGFGFFTLAPGRVLDVISGDDAPVNGLTRMAYNYSGLAAVVEQWPPYSEEGKDPSAMIVLTDDAYSDRAPSQSVQGDLILYSSIELQKNKKLVNLDPRADSEDYFQLLHEFGHTRTFGPLAHEEALPGAEADACRNADLQGEQAIPRGYSSLFCGPYLGSEPMAMNASTNSRKWSSAKLGAGRYYPEAPEIAPEGSYWAKGIYHPTEACRMGNDPRHPYCIVCLKAIRKRLDAHKQMADKIKARSIDGCQVVHSGKTGGIGVQCARN